jgi:hypothetical protein
VMKEEPKPGTNDVAAAPEVKATGTTNILSSSKLEKKEVTLTNSPSGTNGVPAAGEAVAKPAPPENPSPEEKAPLEEAERILDDYMSLLHTGGTLTAEQQHNCRYSTLKSARFEVSSRSQACA